MTTLDPRMVRQVAAALARQNFKSFATRASPLVNGEPLLSNWHIAAIAHKLDQVACGEVKRLIICLPPRCLKSYLANLCFPAWLLGRDPSSKIICASYASSLAEKFSLDTRQLMQTAWYRSLFPNTVLNPQKISKEEFTTTAKGFRLATSVGGTLTGRGGDYIILDDPLKASDAYSEAARSNCIEWYQTTVQSRLNNPKEGAIIVVAQRLHAQDLPGHLMNTAEWDQLILPMEASYDQELDVLRNGRRCRVRAGRLLQPERHGPAELKRLKAEMGERDYEAQYNQRPLPPGGALFKRSWINRYDEPLKPDAYEGIFQSWDTAYEIGESTDYSVCTTWGVLKGQYHLLDVFRSRLEFPDLHQSVLALRRKWGAINVVVEGVGSGLSVAQNVRREDGGQDWLRTLKPATSKENRASQQTVKVEQGKVWLPRSAPWLQELEDELFSFPNGKHDDQVDSIVQFLAAVDMSFLRGGKVQMRVY